MKRRDRIFVIGAMLETAMLIALAGYGQSTVDGAGGINEANTLVRSYFGAAINLMYAIGAIVGLIGAVRVYGMWSSGDPHTGKVATAWFSACIFLVVVALVIQYFFGVTPTATT